MSEVLRAGLRFLPLSRFAREEVRAATMVSAEENPLVFGKFVSHALWAALVSEYVRSKGAAPNSEDCDAMRVLAEYLLDDAVACADRLVMDNTRGNAAPIDALLQRARTIQWGNLMSLRIEEAHVETSRDTMLARAQRYAMHERGE